MHQWRPVENIYSHSRNIGICWRQQHHQQQQGWGDSCGCHQKDSTWCTTLERLIVKDYMTSSKPRQMLYAIRTGLYVCTERRSSNYSTRRDPDLKIVIQDRLNKQDVVLLVPSWILCISYDGLVWSECVCMNEGQKLLSCCWMCCLIF